MIDVDETQSSTCSVRLKHKVVRVWCGRKKHVFVMTESQIGTWSVWLKRIYCTVDFTETHCHLHLNTMVHGWRG